LPAEGVALLVRRSDTWPPVAAAARAPARHLALLVGGGADAAPDAGPLAALLGLGPGLTPSGDDFLGGALVALHLLGRDALCDAIWAALAPHIPASTNEISAAHLAAAAQGFGSAALHALLDDVLAGRVDSLPARIAALAAIGHTSGWDALVGAIIVLQATSALGE
jgi:hypothetical protein